MNSNRVAFLDAIAWSEGTEKVAGSDRGYDVCVGNGLFPRLANGKPDYREHPHPKIWIPRIKDFSTAAGRYQLLYRYWVDYVAQLKLFGFGPDVQDAIALAQLRECHALAAIDDGEFDVAVGLAASRWASFPGAGYKQRENRIADLRAVYKRAGGMLAVARAA